MDNFDHLKSLFNSFINKRQPKRREMKRVFQWRRYIEWKDLTPDEKISAKRFLLIPIFAYLVILIFNETFYLIILLLIGYVLYKKFEKDGIIKK
tara:strand:+ start:434 stop:715 length:282 start_codon:yes stop_codon:yes gene_type:complete